MAPRTRFLPMRDPLCLTHVACFVSTLGKGQIFAAVAPSNDRIPQHLKPCRCHFNRGSAAVDRYVYLPEMLAFWRQKQPKR